MDQVNYCLIGCKSSNGDRRQTERRSKLCGRCEEDLHEWLRKIPELYALLPTFIERGSVERNPESVSTKAAEAPAPMRLEIIDLLDTRLGRKWNGTAAANDRRGVTGTLQVHAERLIEERRLSTPHDGRHLSSSCALLDKHRLWIAERDWVTYLYLDLKQIHRDLADATGDYRRPPVGRCHVDTDDHGRCDGPLFASKYGGVRCARCDATWAPERLRQLGLAQTGQDSA